MTHVLASSPKVERRGGGLSPSVPPAEGAAIGLPGRTSSQPPAMASEGRREPAAEVRMAALGLPGVCRVASAFTSVRGHCCASFRPLNLSWGPGAFLELSSGPSTGRAWAVFARGADDRPLAAVRGLLPAGVDAVF